MTIDVRVSGPLFDGRARAAVKTYLDEAEQVIAQELHDQVLAVLGRSLRNPTGRYESRVRVDRRGDDPVVTDRGVIYGAWLVGVGGRNQSSSFKGYSHFRRARQAVEPRVPAVAERVLRPYLGRMQ